MVLKVFEHCKDISCFLRYEYEGESRGVSLFQEHKYGEELDVMIDSTKLGVCGFLIISGCAL